MEGGGGYPGYIEVKPVYEYNIIYFSLTILKPDWLELKFDERQKFQLEFAFPDQQNIPTRPGIYSSLLNICRPCCIAENLNIPRMMKRRNLSRSKCIFGNSQ